MGTNNYSSRYRYKEVYDFESRQLRCLSSCVMSSPLGEHGGDMLKEFTSKYEYVDMHCEKLGKKHGDKEKVEIWETYFSRTKLRWVEQFLQNKIGIILYINGKEQLHINENYF